MGMYPKDHQRGRDFLDNAKVKSDIRNQKATGLRKPIRAVMLLQNRWIEEDWKEMSDTHTIKEKLLFGTGLMIGLMEGT